MTRTWVLALVVLAAGCGGSGPGSAATATRSPTVAATITPSPGATATVTATRTPETGEPRGPEITYFGLVRSDGCRIGCFQPIGCRCDQTPTPAVDEHGHVVFPAQSGGRGLLVVEGRPGASGFPPGIVLVPEDPGHKPDLLLAADRPLGNGSPAVCDEGPPPPRGSGGGIPAVDPPEFDDDDSVVDALRDFACRFAVQPTGSDDACTLDSFGNNAFVSDRTTIQFCGQITNVTQFAVGDTTLTARLRDVVGNLGPVAQIVVRNEPADGLSADR